MMSLHGLAHKWRRDCRKVVLAVCLLFIASEDLVMAKLLWRAFIAARFPTRQAADRLTE